MKAIYVLAVVVAAVASADAKAAQIQEKHPIDFYDCSGKQDGNYIHPSDCTRFISCSGGIASERDCSPCNENDTPGRCRDGRLVYDASNDRCNWADETECRVGGGGGGGQNGTTSRPPTNTATQQPPVENTTPRGSDNELPVPGSKCDERECLTAGWCDTYYRCENGTWVEDKCGGDLMWNRNGDGSVHGGNCDTWENLSPETVKEYRESDECVGCFWRANDCSRDYEYQPPNGTRKNVLNLSCSEGLVFSLEKNTCQLCQDVTDSNNKSCC